MKIDPDVPTTCAVCGRETEGMNVRYPVCTDDGKPAGTPYRWRHIGYTCCANHLCEAERNKTDALG